MSEADVGFCRLGEGNNGSSSSNRLPVDPECCRNRNRCPSTTTPPPPFHDQHHYPPDQKLRKRHDPILYHLKICRELMVGSGPYHSTREPQR